MDLTKQCTVEFDDGRVSFLGWVEPGGGQTDIAVGEGGEMIERAVMVRLTVVESGLLFTGDEDPEDLDPGTYLVTQDGLFKQYATEAD